MRVARLMRQTGLVGCHRRRPRGSTRRDPAATPAADQVRRQFVATAPNRLWTADITYVPTAAGFLYLAVVLDVYSRRIVGWAMAAHLRTELVLAALEMALWDRRPARGVIHHSDQGCQYTAVAFGRRCEEEGVVPSTGSVGDC
jgi:putative transposase